MFFIVHTDALGNYHHNTLPATCHQSSALCGFARFLIRFERHNFCPEKPESMQCIWYAGLRVGRAKRLHLGIDAFVCLRGRIVGTIKQIMPGIVGLESVRICQGSDRAQSTHFRPAHALPIGCGLNILENHAIARIRPILVGLVQAAQMIPPKWCLFAAIEIDSGEEHRQPGIFGR